MRTHCIHRDLIILHMLFPCTIPQKSRQQRVFNSWLEPKQNPLYMNPSNMHHHPDKSAWLPPDSRAMLVLPSFEHQLHSCLESQEPCNNTRFHGVVDGNQSIKSTS